MKKYWDQFPIKKELIASSSNSEVRNYDVNAHVHTPFSFSAFMSVEEAFIMAKNEGVKVLGINDFNTTDGYDEWARFASEYNVFPLFNIEFVGLSEEEQAKGIKINDPNNPGRIYISGKGLSFPAKLAEPYFSQLESVKTNSNLQVKEMCDALNIHLGQSGTDLQLSFDEIKESFTRGMVRERHLAQALRIKVFAAEESTAGRRDLFRKIFGNQDLKSDIAQDAAIENEIRSRLLKAGGPAFVAESPEQFLNLEQIRQIILNSGGIPTYPLLADSVNGGYTEFEESKESLLETLKNKGFYSVEFIPNRNTTESLEEYADFFVENGFFVSFGSEHNSPDRFPLLLRDKNGNELSPKLKKINFEGACILAAHQYLKARYGEGCIDANAKPFYGKREEYITIGRSLIGSL